MIRIGDFAFYHFMSKCHPLGSNFVPFGPGDPEGGSQKATLVVVVVVVVISSLKMKTKNC